MEVELALLDSLVVDSDHWFANRALVFYQTFFYLSKKTLAALFFGRRRWRCRTNLVRRWWWISPVIVAVVVIWNNKCTLFLGHKFTFYYFLAGGGGGGAGLTLDGAGGILRPLFGLPAPDGGISTGFEGVLVMSYSSFCFLGDGGIGGGGGLRCCGGGEGFLPLSI